MSTSLVTAPVLAAIAAGGAVGSVQAKPVWVFPNKSTPHVLLESQFAETIASSSSSPRSHNSAATAIFHTAGRILGCWWRTYMDWRWQRMAIAQLEHMSDLELKDIGLDRSQIEAGVRGDLERDPSLVRRGVRRRTQQEVELQVA